MFRVTKSGLTLAGKVWEEGEIISDEQVEGNNLNEWYDSLEKDARQRKMVVKVKGGKSPKKSDKEEKKAKKEEKKELGTEELIIAIEEKGVAFEEALKLPWKEMVTNFGIQLASQLNKYGKSRAEK